MVLYDTAIFFMTTTNEAKSVLTFGTNIVWRMHASDKLIKACVTDYLCSQCGTVSSLATNTIHSSRPSQSLTDLQRPGSQSHSRRERVYQQQIPGVAARTLKQVKQPAYNRDVVVLSFQQAVLHVDHGSSAKRGPWPWTWPWSV